MGLSDFFQNTKNNIGSSKLANLLFNNDYKNIDYVKNMPALKPAIAELPNIQIEEDGVPTVNTQVPTKPKLSLKERIFGVQPINTFDDTSSKAGDAISAGLQSSPPRGGFLNDFADGYKDNRFNSFSIDNLSPAKKGFAERFGEGLGTALRFAESPVGRGLITAGAISAFGGSPLQMAGYGASAGALNQGYRNADALYRNQLQSMGIGTDNIPGYVRANDFGNLYKSAYTQGALKNRQKQLENDYEIAQTQINEKKINDIFDQYEKHMISREDAISKLNALGYDINNLLKSNAAINAETAQGNLQVSKGNLELNRDKFEHELNEDKNLDKIKELDAVKTQFTKFENMFKIMPRKFDAYTTGMARKYTGTLTPAETNFNAQRTLLFNVIARQLGGEKGVLSDQDIKRVSAALPTLTDSYDQKLAKMKALRQLLNIREEQYGSSSIADPLGILYEL